MMSRAGLYVGRPKPIADTEIRNSGNIQQSIAIGGPRGAGVLQYAAHYARPDMLVWITTGEADL